MLKICSRPFFLHALTEFSPERCAAPNLNADTVLQTFDRTCYEFHVTRGESFDKAQQICKSHGKYAFNCLFARTRVKNAIFYEEKKLWHFVTHSSSLFARITF